MKAPKNPETPVARHAPKPASKMTPGLVTQAIHEPKTVPNVVMAPSKPFMTKYLLTIPPALATWR